MNKMIRLIRIIVFLILLLPIPYLSALNLELTQGIDKSIPIAVAAFASKPVDVAGNTTFSSVITHDLNQSGRFEVQQIGLVPVKTLTTEQFNVWRRLGVNNVLLGSINSSLTGATTIHAKLVNTYSRRVLWQTSLSVAHSKLRIAAHQLANKVFKQLTGIQGIFTTKIAYVMVQGQPGQRQHYALEVADIDGYNPKAIVVSSMPIMSPVWSPDGNKIAYVSFEKNRARVYLQDLITGNRTAISTEPGVNAAPAFAPNGRQIALVLSKSGVLKIYLYDLTTGRLQQLTKGYSLDTEPSFSADGTRLLFTSNREGGVQIFQDDLNEGKITRLTYNGNYNASAHYLGKGNAFVMLHRDRGIFSIAKQNNTDAVQILDRSNNDESPSVAPNGQMVVFSTKYQGKRVLMMVSSDGRIKLRLPARNGNVQEPAWSPYMNNNILTRGGA